MEKPIQEAHDWLIDKLANKELVPGCAFTYLDFGRAIIIGEEIPEGGHTLHKIVKFDNSMNLTRLQITAKDDGYKIIGRPVTLGDVLQKLAESERSDIEPMMEVVRRRWGCFRHDSSLNHILNAYTPESEEFAQLLLKIFKD